MLGGGGVLSHAVMLPFFTHNTSTDSVIIILFNKQTENKNGWWLSICVVDPTSKLCEGSVVFKEAPPPPPPRPGDDGVVEPPELGGVGEAEAASSGPPALPGEPVAEGRAGRDAAEAAEERAERGPAGGGEEAPGVHEPAEEVRRGPVPNCESTERVSVVSCLRCMHFQVT